MTEVDLTAWCRENVARYREYEHINMAVPPTSEDRDTEIVEWVVRVLGNAELAESREVLWLLAERHGSESERVELRDKRTDLLNVRGILWPNGDPSRAPEPADVSVVAPSVQWLADEVERLRAQLDPQETVVRAARQHVAADPAHSRVTLAILTNAVNALDGGEQS